MSESTSIGQLLEALTGEVAPRAEALSQVTAFPSSGLGYSQLNEILLLLGYDRVTHAFFQFLVDDTLDYHPGSGIGSISDFEAAVDRARQLSLLFFGNVKFGFKTLSRSTDELSYFYELTQPIADEVFSKRHDPVVPVDQIDPQQTYYLGYVVQRELDQRLKKNPTDASALAEQVILEDIRARGLRNQHAYLVSDHLDVYVATSMRRRHEYVEIAQFTKRLFEQEPLRDLKLRWFDPTLAYCVDRIDKGLAEALMLKRAKCTLYLAQESDTLGKDSELASTLAQGKPVVAYVPSMTEDELRKSVRFLSELYSQSVAKTILDRLNALAQALAWTNVQVRRWIDDPDAMDEDDAFDLLLRTATDHYDRRANTLREDHPLGVQVNLDTGVANGVLVVRKIEDCAELIYRILTSRLEFKIEKKAIAGVTSYILRENISASVFRVMTGDVMLTNSFWNFYLEPSE